MAFTRMGCLLYYTKRKCVCELLNHEMAFILVLAMNGVRRLFCECWARLRLRCTHHGGGDRLKKKEAYIYMCTAQIQLSCQAEPNDFHVCMSIIMPRPYKTSSRA